MLAAIVRGLAFIPVALTLLPVSSVGRGWVRIWDFPRVQIAATGLLALSAMWRFSRCTLADRILTAGVAGSVLYQGKKIFPYTRLSPKEVRTVSNTDPARMVSLLTANVFMFNRDYHRMLAAIRDADPDVVCLVETDGGWEKALRALEATYPYSQKCPLENTYGMVLFSRLVLVRPHTRFLVRPDVPSIRAVLRLRSGDEVVLYCVHPRPPRPTRSSDGRDAELVMVAHEIDKDQRAAIILGDLNDVGWSYTTTVFQQISDTLDPRVGRGMYNTFNANNRLLRYPLDHVFHTRHFGVVKLARLRHVGSDHFPMLVELALEAGDTSHRRVDGLPARAS